MDENSTELDLSKSGLRVLDDSFLRLTQLRKLNISGNGLSSLENIRACTNLLFLDASKNNISTLKHIQSLERLQVLSLGSNRIRRMEREVLRFLPDLRVLDLSMNMISIIEGLEENLSLQVLDLAHNRIQKLGNLKRNRQLVELRLATNLIDSLSSIDKLLPQSLQTLDLEQNEIAHVVELRFLTDLTRLSTVNVLHNPLQLEAESAGVNYRPFLHFLLPNLQVLDQRRVSKADIDVSRSLFIGKGGHLSDSLLLLLQVGHEKDLLMYLSDKFFSGSGSDRHPSTLPMEGVGGGVGVGRSSDADADADADVVADHDVDRDHLRGDRGKPPMRPDRKGNGRDKRGRRVGEAWDFESERDVFQSRDKLPRSLSQREEKLRPPLPTEFYRPSGAQEETHSSHPASPDSERAMVTQSAKTTTRSGGTGVGSGSVRRTHDVSGTSVSGRRISPPTSSTRSPESVGASPDASRIREDPNLVASLMSEEGSGGMTGLVGEMAQLRLELDQMRKNVTDMRKFFKQSVRAEMKKRQRAAITIQRVFRGYLVRRKIGITTLSSSLNTSFRHAVLIHRRLGLVRLQDVPVTPSSALVIRRARLEGRKSLTKIQALVRGVLVRSRFMRFLEQQYAVVKIQKVWRGYSCRKFCGKKGLWSKHQYEQDRQRSRREWDATVKDLHERLEKESRQRTLQERALRYLWEEMKSVHHEMETLRGREQHRAARVIQKAWKEHQIVKRKLVKNVPRSLESQKRIELLEKEVRFLGEQLESLLTLFGDQMNDDDQEVDVVPDKSHLSDEEDQEQEERRNPLHKA